MPVIDYDMRWVLQLRATHENRLKLPVPWERDGAIEFHAICRRRFRDHEVASVQKKDVRIRHVIRLFDNRASFDHLTLGGHLRAHKFGYPGDVVVIFHEQEDSLLALNEKRIGVKMTVGSFEP